MAQINLGRIQPIDRGTYSVTYPYKELDFVTNTDGTIYYSCIADVPAAGTPLTDTNYFRPALSPNLSGTDSSIPETLVKRDTNGTAKFSAPTDPAHPALAGYVGGLTLVDNASATFTNVDNNISAVGVGVGVEIGDVLTVSSSTNNDTEFTVEFITDDDNVIVNAAHAGKSRTVSPIGTKALIDETATVTIKLLCKWYLAPAGLGQGPVDLQGERTQSVNYPNSTNRTIDVRVTGSATTSAASITVDGFQMSRNDATDVDQNTMSTQVRKNEEYSAFNVGATPVWVEVR